MASQHGWVIAAILVAAIGSPAVARLHASDSGASQQQPPTTVPPKQQSQEARDGRKDGNRDDHSRRPWWRNNKDMAEIGMTVDQSDAIDAIFHTEIEKMKPLRTTINEMERDLNATIRASTTDVAVFTRHVQKIEAKRAELNTMRIVMLYRMRQVLNADQNAKLQAMFDRNDAQRKKQDDDRRR
jgi:Spy/CpxP family protein refolding chaperone